MLSSIFSDNNNSLIFGVIIIGIIIFIVYKGFKKKKTEKIEQHKREDEVIKEIKKYLSEINKLKNVSIKFVKVVARSGKLYKYRDVFDVFVEIKNIKKNKIIRKNAYEVEGIATQGIENKKEINVKWFINKEFEYEKHWKLINDLPSSSWKIHLKSLKIKDKKLRKNWKKDEIEKLKKWSKEQKDRHKKIEKSKENEEEIFKPKIKKRDE